MVTKRASRPKVVERTSTSLLDAVADYTTAHASVSSASQHQAELSLGRATVVSNAWS